MAKLIDIWARAEVQAQLEGCHRNRDVYEKMAQELREEGCNRTYDQCREKLKKLKGDYRKIKDKQHKTGEGRKEWEYFEAIDSVLGHKPATNPPVVIDTSRDNIDITTDGSSTDELLPQDNDSTVVTVKKEKRLARSAQQLRD